MGLDRTQVKELLAVGYTFHDIAQIAKVPTPVIIQIGLSNRQTRTFAFDFDAAMKAKGVVKAAAPVASEPAKEPEKIEKAAKKEKEGTK